MDTRRQFLLKTAAAGAAMAALPYVACETQTQTRFNLGFISGLIGKELKADWRAALKQAASYGFSEYEGGVYADSAQDYLAYLQEVGLTPVAGGIKFSEDMDEVKQSFENVLALGMPYAVSYWPWLVGEPFKLEDCQKSADLLNQIGELAAGNGLTLCWHNHDNEFIEMEAGLPFHYLMDHTDPELVKCEMDSYWVAKGGADPLQVLQQYNGRIPILHVKDMAGDEEQSFACPGSGIIDFPSILTEALDQGIEHYFVERDKAPDGMACLKSSSEYLKSLEL